MQINNEIYNRLGNDWWDESGDGNLVSLRYLSNPVKFRYIHSIIRNQPESRRTNNSVLDVGCGGGYLSEELAKSELDVIGIDPSRESIEAAKAHAEQENLDIKYFVGYGERLPFESNTFDFVCCCDVLEHVKDYRIIVQEISRVLKNGGIFFYDTINRTVISKFVMIKIMQEWKSTSFLDPNVHIWDMFIKPKELLEVLSDHQLIHQEIKGISPRMNFISHYLNLRRRSKSQITWKELGAKLNLGLSNNLSSTYIGYAIKSTQ